MSTLIRKNFHVQIAAVCSIHQVDEIVRNTLADLVVSTIPVCVTSVPVNYLNAMVSLVHRYGPYIVLSKGVALAHAAPEDGMLAPGISLVRLRTPVSFGQNTNDPVSVVFACALVDNPVYTAALGC